MKYIILFFFTIYIGKSAEFSRNILDSLSNKLSTEIANKLFENKSYFIFNDKFNAQWNVFFQNKIIGELKQIQSTKIDTAFITIRNCDIYFENIANQDEYLQRSIKINLDYQPQSNPNALISFSKNYKDTILSREADYLNQNYPFERPKLPSNDNENNSFKKITEAIIVTASSALAVILFFSVRSK